MGREVRATEAGLALDSTPEAFGAAMLHCQAGSDWCSRHGSCFYEGECFRSDSSARRTALRLLNDLASGQPADVATWIHTARSSLLSQGDTSNG